MHFTPSAVTLGREALRVPGMQMVLYKRSDNLYHEMVSLDLRVYQDKEFIRYVERIQDTNMITDKETDTTDTDVQFQASRARLGRAWAWLEWARA
jgi:hypothetical protein